MTSSQPAADPTTDRAAGLRPAGRRSRPVALVLHRWPTALAVALSAVTWADGGGSSATPLAQALVLLPRCT